MEIRTGRCLKNNKSKPSFTDVENETREWKGLAPVTELRFGPRSPDAQLMVLSCYIKMVGKLKS